MGPHGGAGLISGDHHVHAAGCSHYDNPTAGVTPQDMMRHILGEDLQCRLRTELGAMLVFSKTVFEGNTSKLSLPQTLMRYDVEVSGFPLPRRPPMFAQSSRR